jgi:azurin
MAEAGGGGLRRRTFVAGLAAPALLAACHRKSARERTVDLYVESDGDFLAFRPTLLVSPSGAHVRLTFHHAGEIVTQKHDWVLVRQGELKAVTKAADTAGPEGRWNAAADPRVLAATPEIGRGETAVIEFTAPSPGDYPFLCTTAGHGAEMHGVFRVVP